MKKKCSACRHLLLLAILVLVKDSPAWCNLADAAPPPASWNFHLNMLNSASTANHTTTTTTSIIATTLRTLQFTSCEDELEACNEDLKVLQNDCSSSSANLWLAEDKQQEEETNEAGGNFFPFVFDIISGIFDILLSIITGFFGFFADQRCRNNLQDCQDKIDSFVCPNTQSPTAVPVAPTPPTATTPQPQPGAPVPPTLQPVAQQPSSSAPQQPVSMPSTTKEPTSVPTRILSPQPTHSPTQQQTPQPTSTPVEPITTVTTFYALGDVPYDSAQETLLTEQMENLPNDASFLVHVGDLRKNNGKNCTLDEFRNVASILSLSPIPVFVMLGDNDWNDCKNPEDALEYWKAEFVGFETRFWDPTFAVDRLSERPENLSFIHNEVLFIGLNIVGGSYEAEWEDRLDEELNWSLDLIRSYVQGIAPRIGRIVLFGHANPKSDHRRIFFDPLADFIEQELNNETPFLYVNGDGHFWVYQTNFLNQESLVRIMVSAYAEDPPVRISVHANGETDSTTDAFQYIR